MANPILQQNPVTINFVDTSPAVSQSVPVTAANPLPVYVASGSTDQDVNLVGINGVAPAVGSGALNTGTQRIALATDSPGVIPVGGGVPTLAARVTIADQYSEYETVAAAQTAQVLGATGATGDYCGFILVIPATTSPGNVILLDNATSITIFTGGASSVTSLVPFAIPIGAYSVSGAWKLTTGANVSCIGFGNFT